MAEIHSASAMRKIEGWGYPIVLLVLFALFLAQPWASRSAAGSALIQLTYSAIIVGALIVVSSRRWVMACGIALVITGVVLGQFADVSGGPVAALAIGCSLAVLLIVIGMILNDVISHPQVTVGTISGSICVFVLLGIAWMLMYSIVDQITVDAFHGLSPKGDSRRSGELFYFSFVTLSTLGYGNITPARPETMSLATLEAVVGQLYLVVMVAAFVGRRSDVATAPGANLRDRE